MDPITQQVVLATAGAAGAGDPTYVDDVFSTFLYEGTGSSRSINNGIDLSGEGGLVWIKNRQHGYNNALYDTERGALKQIQSNNASGEGTEANSVTAFNSNGFSLSTFTTVNKSGHEIVAWTFRKAPGFFDVVTYTGNNYATTAIPHSLGSVPGMIIVKRLDAEANWQVYHRSTGNAQSGILSGTNGFASTNAWGSTSPTSTHFYVGNSSFVNGSSSMSYVAYLFAHDDQSFGTDSDEAIVKCGSFTTPSSGSFTVDLGFEPQWLITKRSSGDGGSWSIRDVMRGWTVVGHKRLLAESSQAELSSTTTDFPVTSTGFSSSSSFLGANQTYVYMAIRRPHKPPEAATDVFKAVQTNSQPVSVGFPTDLIITAVSTEYWVPRLTNARMQSSDTSSEDDVSSYFKFDLQNSFSTTSWWGQSSINWYFRRAPGFFDVVTYTGTGSAHTQSHNLEVAPELQIIKSRTISTNWVVETTAIDGSFDYLYLNKTDAKGNAIANGPTSTSFNLIASGETNSSGRRYIAYLFASLDGISKVGTYSGTGSNVNVDCGFTAGARFVLIKRTDSSGDWYVWDSTRGIVSGNDPYLLLNSTAAQVTNTDYIDPLNAGFTVTSSAPAALNTSGGTYLFLAIA